MRKKIMSGLLILSLICFLTPKAKANNTKLVALTFDDGPSQKYTPQLLDALAERDVKVTFFLVGYTLKVNLDIAKRAFEEGHQLANHSYSHTSFTRLSADGIRKELGDTNALLSEATGLDSFLVRVPYGSLNANVRGAVGAPIIQWSVDPTNGKASTGEDAMFRNLMDTVRDGSIILLHDTSQKNLNVALRAIDELLAQGYEFVTLNELFRLRGVQPAAGTVYYSVYPGAAETAFNEEKLSEHWAHESIDTVMSRGIMLGDDGGFRPNEYLSRAMAAAILYRLAALSDKPGVRANEPEGACVFSDVEAGSWFCKAVTWAYDNSYVVGVGGNKFEPLSFITKEQFYTILARFAHDELQKAGANGALSALSYRDDVRTSAYAHDGVMLFRNAGFVSMNDPELLRPGDNITRAEAAELISFLLELLPAQEMNRLQPGGGYYFAALGLCALAYAAARRGGALRELIINN